MMIGGFMVVGIMLAWFFLWPSQTLDDDTRDLYERTMQVELDDDDARITMYESIRFGLEARSRARVRHY